MKKFKKKNIWLRILGCVLLVSLLGAVAFSIFKITDESTEESVSPSFAVGSLDADTGVYKKSEGSIYTKKAFLCQGLKITLDFDSTVSYRVFLYDSKNNFLMASESLTSDFNLSSNAPVWTSDGYINEIIPSFAKYARIVVTPHSDDSVNLFEIRKYAKQLNISVSKDQTYMYENNMLKSLTQTKISVEGSDVKQPGGYNRTVGQTMTTYAAYARSSPATGYIPVWNSNIIDVSGCEYVTVVCYGEQTFDYFIADSDRKVLRTSHLNNTDDASNEFFAKLEHYGETGLWICKLSVEDAKYFAITVAETGNLNNFAIFVR